MTREYDGRKSQARRDALEAQVGPGETLPVAITFANGQPDLTMHAYRKTVLTYAARIDEPFSVWTNEGTMQGKAGDYLAVGPAGEMYPIDKAVFAASYEEVVDDA